MGGAIVRKKVDVQSLEIGMYIVELDRPWLGTPFLFQGFEIRTAEEIAELQRYCKWVYIQVPDTFGLPGSGGLKKPLPSSIPAAIGDSDKKLEHDFLKIVNQPRLPLVYHDQTTLEEEIQNSKEQHQEVRRLIYSIMDDARHGKNIDTVRAKKSVAALVESVIRNPDALTCFTQLKEKDEYTALHSLRVCILALAFGRHLGLGETELNVLGIGALLHDIGKVTVPSDILNKPGQLDEYEYALMKGHVPRGVEILTQTRGIPAAAIEVARCHHERYTGGGYISGLKGEQIGLFGMIGGIVDCYDAITSDRPYHAGMATHAGLKKMYEWRHRDFQPQLIEKFIQCMGIYPIGSVVELNTGEIGVVVAMNRVRRLKPRVALVLKADSTPFGVPKTVDLMEHRMADGRSCEIERVLEPGIYGINPIDYLPVGKLRIN